jgi:hypothetical protein
LNIKLSLTSQVLGENCPDCPFLHGQSNNVPLPSAYSAHSGTAKHDSATATATATASSAAAASGGAGGGTGGGGGGGAARPSPAGELPFRRGSESGGSRCCRRIISGGCRGGRHACGCWRNGRICGSWGRCWITHGTIVSGRTPGPGRRTGRYIECMKQREANLRTLNAESCNITLDSLMDHRC